MTSLLYAELLKLRTTRTFVVLTALAVTTSVIVAGLVSLLTDPTKESVLVDVFTTDFSSFFIMVLAVVGITGEWRHRTITSSLLAAPDRRRFLGAKTLAFAAAGLVVSLLVSIAVAIVGVVVLSVRDLPLPEAGELLGQMGRNAVVAMLLSAFGVGIGALVRNQVAAVTGLLAGSFAVEPILITLAPHVGRFGPFVGLPTAAADIPPEAAGLSESASLAPELSVLLLLAWIGIAFVAGASLLRRRDLE